jgi:DNA polymerase bacteriophage-type
MKLWLDLETRSPIPLKRDIANYAQKAEIIMVQWAVDDGPVVVEEEISQDLCDAAMEADEVWAHGAEFEQQILTTVMGSPWLEPEKWRCTMALARMHGLPGALQKLSDIFKLGLEGKDERGYQLIQFFCIPRNKDGGYNDKRSHPKEWAEFREYGASDITSMRAVYRKCPKWNSTPRMWKIWHLDQKMNAHGVAVDLALCEGALAAVEKAKRKLREKTTDLTLGVVESTTQVARLRAYCEEFGVTLPDLTADTVERRLEDPDLPDHVKELLRLRQDASKSSGAKFKRALTQQVDGRLRNLLVFCGASRTGRWAGRTFQPQNLPRPKHAPWDIDLAIEAFRSGTIETYTKTDVLGLANSSLRGIMVCEQGRRLVAADLANIEGRKMAWLAGERWKLDAFAAFDRKEGPDLYKASYARSFNIDPLDIKSDDDPRRQIGKVQELALQYYGGVGAFCSMADTYGLRLDDLARAAWPVIPRDIKERAKENYGRAVKRRRTYGLPGREWTVCESLVLMWRDAHPAIVAFWSSIERALGMAVRNTGKSYRAGRVTFDRQSNWLRIRLPSGRFLSYPAPRVGDRETSFVGVDPYTKQWKRISTYSGKIAANITQASAADILMDGIVAADEAGYMPVLSVHDEIICEPPDEDGYDDKELSRLMIESSPWAAGLPLAAKGFTAYRYAKK